MNKKGSEEAINTIKKMILALIILVVLILIFNSQIRKAVSGIWTTFDENKKDVENEEKGIAQTSQSIGYELLDLLDLNYSFMLAT